MTDTPLDEAEPDPDRLYFDPREVNAAIIRYRRELRDSPKEAERQLRKATLSQHKNIGADWAWLPDLSDEEVARRLLRVDEVDDDLERSRLLRQLESRGYRTDAMDRGQRPLLRQKLEEGDLNFFKPDD
jgi:hypothetical protein